MYKHYHVFINHIFLSDIRTPSRSSWDDEDSTPSRSKWEMSSPSRSISEDMRSERRYIFNINRPSDIMRWCDFKALFCMSGAWCESHS